MEQLLFILAMSLMFTHELDAVRRHEWRIFPGTNLLSDEIGFMVFLLAHVPLFGLVLWATFLQPESTALAFQMGFSAFCIIHVLLHWIYRNHPANEFDNPLSRSLIWGSGAAGAGHLLLGAA